MDPVLAASDVKVVKETKVITCNDFVNSSQILNFHISSEQTFHYYFLGIDFVTQKIAKLLKPQKVIEQNGDSFTIHTYGSLRNYLVQFKVREEF
jgi:hypothetical protein